MEWVMAARRRCWGTATDKRSARQRKLKETAEDVLEGLKRYDLSKRPEVRFINRYVRFRTCVMLVFKAVGSLALLWSAAVHLGGFFRSLKEDFWYLTFIGFVQAAGIFNVLADDQFIFVLSFLLHRYAMLVSLIEKLQKHVLSRLLGTSEEEEIPMSPACQAFYKIIFVITHVVTLISGLPVFAMAVIAPASCLQLSWTRLERQDYGSANGDAASKANLKPALNIFYSLAVAQSALYLVWIFVELSVAGPMLYLCNKYGYERGDLDDYITETKRKCIDDMSLSDDWNLITYALGLLDSESPYSDDYCSGLRILHALIEEKVPVNQLMVQCSRQRIQKLISMLGWRRPIDREIRELAAMILAHLASNLSLADFPGALESISSLLEAHSYKKDQESLHFPLRKNQSKRNSKKRVLEDIWAKLTMYAVNYHYILSRHEQGMKIRQGAEEELILQGLRIVENLAHNERNCTEIYKNKDLLSKMIAPVSSDKFIEEVETNGGCSIRVIDGTLKVVVRLIGAHGDIEKHMYHDIARDTNKGEKDASSSKENMKAAVCNLVKILGMKRNSNIIELQTQSIEILAQPFLYESTILDKDEREKIIQSMLQFLFSEKWMSEYLQEKQTEARREATTIKVDYNIILWSSPSLKALLWVLTSEKRKKRLMEEHEKKKMEKAKEIASQLKAKAGEALALLLSTRSTQCDYYNLVMDFTSGCGDVKHYLTKMLDSKITTIKCTISGSEVVDVPIKIGCRISAAEILKYMCAHSTRDHSFCEMVLRNVYPHIGDHSFCKTVLSKVLEELLHINTTATEPEASNVSTVSRASATTTNDVEDPRPRPSRSHEDEAQIPESNKQQCDKRRFQAALLSLYRAIRATWSDNEAGDFASRIVDLVASIDFAGKIKALIKENSYATPACVAMLKIICEMVILLVQHGHCVQEFKDAKIIYALFKASKTVASLEGCMLFAGMDVDSYGVPLKPVSSVLVGKARELLYGRRTRATQMANDTIPARTGLQVDCVSLCCIPRVR